MKRATALLPFLVLPAGLAAAHSPAGEGGFAAGLAHPLTGADHLLAMLAVGLLVALGRRLPLTAGVALAGAFALLHGYAHGVGMPAGTAAIGYAAGLVLASLALNGLGVAGGMLSRWPVRAGVLAIAAGLMLGAGP
ncbi:MAG: HupE/UreJ family protein [Pseudomonadota bacterium]|nr:HupE/UreJ family protein [Pseudomonadota bacterium]